MLTHRPGWSVALLLLALAVSIWPLVTVSVGGRGARPGAHPVRGAGRPTLRWAVGGAMVAAVLIGRWAGWPTGLAAALLAGTALRLSAAGLRRRRLRAERVTLVVTLGAFCRELRAGTATREATELAASAAGEPLGSRLRAAVLQADHTGSGSSVAVAGRGSDALADLVAALRISDRHGVPLADLVEVIADDVARAAAADEVRIAQTAGPRFSGFVLGALPLFGVLLGVGIGADPVAVLLGGGTAGSVLLVVGTALVSAGLLWSARIVSG